MGKSQLNGGGEIRLTIHIWERKKTQMRSKGILNHSVLRFLLDYLSFITLYYFLVFLENILNQNFTSPGFSEIRNSKHRYVIEKYITDSEIDGRATIICRKIQRAVTKQEIRIPLLQYTFIKAQQE